MDKIRIRGARTHNLKNVDIDLPRDRLIVITGLSGSGKSSLAFDTLYAEGQRRYVESLSTYARQFLSLMEKPDVDLIEGLSPAISIEQKSTSHNPRSTVGTVTEIYDYLRLLFARVGEPRCPDHDLSLDVQTVSQMVDQIMGLAEGTKLMLLAPVVQDRKGEYAQLFDQLHTQGYLRARVDGIVVEIDQPPILDKKRKHTVEVVVDRVVVRPGQQSRIAESLETAIGLSKGIVKTVLLDDNTTGGEITFSARYACPQCGYSLTELEPRLFSFNNPAGACPTCDGIGVRQFFDPGRVVSDPTLSLPAGAIRGWDRRNPFYFDMLESLARHYRFDLDTPFCNLPKNLQQVILDGSGNERIAFRYGERGRRREHLFEGVIPNLERRYRETESSMVREELSRYLSTRPCEACKGGRLRREALHVFIDGRSINALTAVPISDALRFFQHLELSGHRQQIAEKIVKEIASRLGFLVNVGLEYLNLSRAAETLSGGEAQRIRLASQIGAGLVGVMYVLDEPSIGLHQRDNDRLLATLKQLRDLGNTVIVVEHDEDAIRSADHVVDIGPGAGAHGGRIVAQGSVQDLVRTPESITGQYLSGRERIEVPSSRHHATRGHLTIRGACGNNLKNIDVSLPVGLMTCVTGVSGSGKSTLVNDTLYAAVANQLYRSRLDVAPHAAIDNLDLFDKVVDIDQSPIGRTPRSNPATYTGLFTPLRELFSGTPEARARGYNPGRFSFNVTGGRCDACEGEGMIKVEMHFLPDVYVACDICLGQRYNRETLEIQYKGKSIHDVLEMTVEEAATFFDAIPVVRKKLDTLMEVGLSYIRLGQSATTLSGGEAQRIKLARELAKRDTGNTLYILDEPTTGLHFHDIKHLLLVLQKLRDQGNTIIIIEHNLDVIKTTDWIVDLGPEGGDKGGEVIICGTPEEVAHNLSSYTGRYLRPALALDGPRVARSAND